MSFHKMHTNIFVGMADMLEVRVHQIPHAQVTIIKMPKNSCNKYRPNQKAIKFCPTPWHLSMTSF